MKTTVPRAATLAVPLLLVNGMAIWGQAGWAYQHLVSSSLRTNHPATALAVCLLFAAAVESIGIYLAWEAHSALMADQAAGLLRLGSYAVGALVGALNYAHFAGDAYTPTAQAITFGLLSAISPWLWAIRSRSMNRDRLRELELIDERGVRLSTSRKLWHPIRSLRVMSWAAWAGVTNPAAAVAGWEASRRPAPAATVAATPVDTVEMPELLPAIAAQPYMAPEDPAAGIPGGVQLAAADAARIARALQLAHPDMGPDMIAPLVGRSERQVKRYLNGYAREEASVG